MLARLDNAFRRERQFTADASHELRTPLAARQAVLSVTRQRPRTRAEYEEALDDLTETTERMRGLVETLLQLARDDMNQPPTFALINMPTLLLDIVGALEPQIDEKGLTLVAQFWWHSFQMTSPAAAIRTILLASLSIC